MIIQLIKTGDYKVEIWKNTFPNEGPVITITLGEFRLIFGKKVYEELIEKERICVVPVLEEYIPSIR